MIVKTLIGFLIFVSTVFGYFMFKPQINELGAVIFTTDSSQTLSTFRTNVNTSLANLQGAVGSATTTNPFIISYVVATSTTATSTFTNGANIVTGCYAVNGTCLTTGSSLDGLSDVAISGVAKNQILKYDGSNFVNVATSTLFANSADFGKWLSDETGTGNVVFSASPTMTGTIAGAALTLTTPLVASSGGTGAASYAVGDILYASGATTLTKLVIGTTNQVLKVAGGVPSWGTDSTGGASGGSGNVATSTAETQFRIPFWDSSLATPALLNGGDADLTFTGGYLLTATKASTTQLTNTGTTWLTGLTSALMGTDNTGKVVASTTVGTNLLKAPASAILAGDQNGQITASTTIGWNLIKGAASSIFGFNQNGQPVATTSIGANFLSGTVAVANGGSGAATLTGVLLGNGTSPFTVGSAQTCTNQFFRSLSASYAVGCATVRLDPTTDVTGTLGLANGGTNATSFGTTNGVTYYNGTRLVTDADIQFDGTNLTIASTTFGGPLTVGGVVNFQTSTTTFSSTGGINLNDGCFAIDGNCLSTSGGGGGVTTLDGLSDVVLSGPAYGKLLMHDGSNWVDNATTSLFSTSGQFATWLSDETGTGNVVLSASPTLTGLITAAAASTTDVSISNSLFLTSTSSVLLAVNQLGRVIGTSTIGANLISGLPVGANPSGTIGLSAVNGSLTTFLRSDASPALSQSITPSWTGLHLFLSGATSTNFTVFKSFFAPTSTDPFIAGAGAFAINTTAASSSLRWNDGTAERATFSENDVVWYYSTTTPVVGSTTIKLAGPIRQTTYTKMGCISSGGAFVVQLGDGNASSTPATSVESQTLTSFTTLAANNTFNKGEIRYITFGTPSSQSIKDLSCGFGRRYDAD